MGGSHPDLESELRQTMPGTGQSGKGRAWKARRTGEIAVCLVSAELWQQDFVVSSTSRNIPFVDLLAASNKGEGGTVSIQVKANSPEWGKQGWWNLGNKAFVPDPTHYFVFVNLKKAGERPDFFVVPSAEVSGNQRQWDKWGPTFPARRQELEAFRDKWEVLRRPPSQLAASQGGGLGPFDADSRRPSPPAPG